MQQFEDFWFNSDCDCSKSLEMPPIPVTQTNWIVRQNITDYLNVCGMTYLQQ